MKIYMIYNDKKVYAIVHAYPENEIVCIYLHVIVTPELLFRIHVYTVKHI